MDDALIVAIYVMIDDTMKTLGHRSHYLAGLSDTEVLTVAVLLAGGVDGALGRVLAVVGAALADGTWARLKVCRNEGCQWAFYDVSKNCSATWCSMAICGSRTKVRAYRRRQRTGNEPPVG